MRGTSSPFSRQQRRHPARGLQAACRRRLASRLAAVPEARLRRKLGIWSMDLFPRVRVARGLAVLTRLRRLVPPRVIAAILRTWYNGWCTARRFQQRAPCLFGCQHGEDSVHHYARCRCLATFGERRLRLRRSSSPAALTRNFLLLDPAADMDDATVTRRALLVAAAYRVHCRCRCLAPFASELAAFQALEQATKESAMGHARAARALDLRWLPRRADVA